jgi:hypothetical protein
VDFSKYVELFYGIAPPIEEWEMRSLHITFAIYKRRVIAGTFNVRKTNPINLRNRKINKEGVDKSHSSFTCSEWRCFREVKRKTNAPFSDITFLNMRMNRNKELCYASPCVGCRSLLAWAEPRAVYFTNNEGKFELYPI